MDEILIPSLISYNYTESPLPSTLKQHIHTLPDPTPIATVFTDTAEHDDRYSEGSHKIFSELYVIQALSELNPAFLYRGTWDMVLVAIVDGIIDASRAITPISV